MTKKSEVFDGQMIPQIPDPIRGVLSVKPKFKKQMAPGVMKASLLPGLSFCVACVTTEQKILILAQKNNGGSFGNNAF
jgi:hypothetical protein